MCKSKVPGVYNALQNRFDPCRREDPSGVLYFKNEKIVDIPTRFTPEEFYSVDFQKEFRCECSPGFVFQPELSRTTCFKDPCLFNLPPSAAAPGYDKKTGECDCGKFFTNLYPNNKFSPCATCPQGAAPSYDRKTNMLTFYVKCRKDDNNDDDNENTAVLPCITTEDKMRGCVKAKVKVKPVKNPDKMSFEQLIFF